MTGAPLTEEQIAAMLDDCENASAASLHAVCRNYVRLLAAEAKRLRESRDASDRYAKNIEGERDAARADLAKAVELLNEASEQGATGDWYTRIVNFVIEQEKRR